MLEKRAIGIFSDYQTMETALHVLRDSGFVMERVSVAGRDMERHPDTAGAKTGESLASVGDTKAHDDRAADTAKSGAVAGTAVGGLTGLLVGLGALAIPGVGPVMLAGAAATAIATAASGSAIGAAAGSLVGGLVGLGISDERANAYGDRVAQGDYLVMVEGSAAEVDRAGSILTHSGIHDWYSYDLPTDPSRIASPVTTHLLDH
jgi:hypothetical protein